MWVRPAALEVGVGRRVLHAGGPRRGAARRLRKQRRKETRQALPGAKPCSAGRKLEGPFQGRSCLPHERCATEWSPLRMQIHHGHP
eukprot:3439529-Pyramimonas_sp.AAC.1